MCVRVQEAARGALALLIAATIGTGLVGCNRTPKVDQTPTLTAYDGNGEFPAYSAPVVDAADLLPFTTEQSLNAKLVRLQRLTTNQLAIVTIPTLKGEKIESFSLRLFNKWGIGSKDRNNGVELIVAPKERRVRIEVGTGLGTVLTDEKSATIIARSIMPHFQKGDFPSGIEAGANAIIAELL